MIDIQFQQDFFDNKLYAEYLHPVTGKPVRKAAPDNELLQITFCDQVRRGLLLDAILALIEKQADYIKKTVKYTEVSSKDKKLFREAKTQFSAALPVGLSIGNMADFSDYAYENIYPYLCMVKPSNSVYDKLLQYVNNQCVDYSQKHTLFTEFHESVKS